MMTMTDVALPRIGDADLDVDVQQISVINVYRHGDGLVVQALGAFPFPSPIPTARTAVDISRPSGSESPQDVTRSLEILQQWQREGTRLRLLGAPEKPLVLLAPDGTTVAFPRHPH